MIPIALTVNGARHEVEVEPRTLLVDFLRDDLDLTGTKFGCGEGQCRACTVLLDGVATRSCLTRVSAAVGKKITTIEGLAPAGGGLHPLQQAFLDHDALQCGYCTPGMILGAAALLTKNPKPSDAEIVTGMDGHVCRCGTYPRVVAAIRAAAERGRA